MDQILAIGGGWGGDGLQGTKAVTAAELLADPRYGGNFEVEGRPVFTLDPKTGTPVKIPDKQAIVRTDTGHVFQVASKQYGIVQPAKLVNVLDDAVGKGAAIYTSAVVLDQGAKLVITAALPETIKIGRTGQDAVKPYLAAINSLDGSVRLMIKALSFRPICRNTAMRAIHSEKDTEFAVRHTRNAEARLSQAMDLIKAAGFTFKRLGDTYQAMALRPFTDRDMTEMARNLLPADDEGDVPTRTVNARETMVTLFAHGKGQREIPEIRGTMWAAYNAATEYVDHLRSTRTSGGASEEQSRLASAWFGSGAALKSQAFEYLQARI